ncbi:MAG: PAS domain S-box protein [Candidatus Thorarchaeota archaeon]|jgi:PAS domain S-box-containing protein
MTNNDKKEMTKQSIVSRIEHRAILEALNDAIHVIDQSMTIVFQNPSISRWLRELNLNPNIEGMRISEAFPFIPEESLDEYRQVFSTGLVHQSSEETKLEGKRIYTEITKIPLVREGSVDQIVTVIRDVTDQKQSQEALEESEEKYRTIVEQSLVGFAIVEGEPVRIPYTNEPMEKITGYSVEEIIEMDTDAVASLVHEDDLEQLRQLIFDCRRKGERQGERMQIRMRRKDSGIAWVELTVNQIDYSEEKAVQIAFVDITERQKAEEEKQHFLEELRAEKEKYQVLFDSAPIAIAVSRENGEILDVNISMQEMLGYSSNMLKEKSAVDFYTKSSDREHLGEMLNKEGKVRDQEVTMITQKRDEIAVLQNVDYVHYEGEIARLSTMRNITELNKAKKDLELARARAEFFNDLMAHDLNNVHQGILVGAELLLRNEGLTQESIKHSSAIRDQVARGIQLIENVRKLSKMEADEELELQPLDLHGIIANAILLVQHGFPGKDIKIDIKFNPEEIIVLADEFLIDLFYNLVHNAMKYNISDQGVIDIIVDSADSDDKVRVAITDKGPGIPDERKRDLFSRLERGRTLGSGMGLTLVKRIAERYKGSAWVEDRVPGSYSMGAKFVVELPRKNSAKAA